MSVIIDAENEGLSIPFSSAEWTVLGWAKLTADVNRYTTIFDVSASTGTNAYMQFSTNDGGTLLGIHMSSSGLDSINMTPGQWYRVGVRRSTTQFTLTVGTATGALSHGTLAVPGAYSPTTLRIGKSVWSGEPWNGPLAGHKVYTAVLSDGEMETEFTRPEAIRTADLWATYNLDAPPGTADTSGNGRTLTAGSAAVTDSADLPPYASPVPAPATVLNLGTGAEQNRFKLQLARPGDPAIDTISLASLVAGFTEAPYFHTSPDGLRVHHEARLDAPTTAGSSSSRCELREVDAAGNDYSWNPAVGEHDIRGTTTITSLPPVKPEVVIAQIFNETAGADLASIRTQLVSGTIRLRFRYQGVSVTSPQMASPYAAGTEFAWRMRVVGGVIEVYWAFGGAALPGTPQITTAAVPTGQACYFKAGLYNQSNVAAGDAGTAIGAAELRALAVTHAAPPDPRLTPLYGLDVNRFRAGLNLATAQNEGLAFVFGKVGQGSSTASGFGQTLDESWPTFRDSALAIGMPLGGYWYLGDTETPESQAARCRAWIGHRGVPLALDWEEGGGEWSNVVACVDAFRAAGLVVRVLYARASWHAAHGGGSIAALDLTLWNARYPVTTGGTPTALYDNVKADLDTYWQTYGGVTTEILQYSDASTIAGTSPVDANAYDGTPAEIAALLAPVAQPAPNPRARGAFAPFFPDRVVIKP